MENKVNTIKNFLEEYERIKPANMEEFDKKRNAAIIGKADDVMELFGCTSWYWFIAACKLPFYIKQEGMDVISFTISMPESKIKEIFPDCNVRSITSKLNEAKLVHEGLEDLRSGKVVDGEAVKDEIKKKF